MRRDNSYKVDAYADDDKVRVCVGTYFVTLSLYDAMRLSGLLNLAVAEADINRRRGIEAYMKARMGESNE